MKISFAQAKEMLDTVPGCVLLDVREEEEYITGHAIDAELLPVGEINAATAAQFIPQKDTPVLVYCRTGYRSGIAELKLRALGYKKIYNIGSLIGWPYGLV